MLIAVAFINLVTKHVVCGRYINIGKHSIQSRKDYMFCLKRLACEPNFVKYFYLIVLVYLFCVVVCQNHAFISLCKIVSKVSISSYKLRHQGQILIHDPKPAKLLYWLQIRKILLHTITSYWVFDNKKNSLNISNSSSVGLYR